MTRRALVVIDVQNEYIDGDFRIEFPPTQVSLANIAKAMDASRKASVPVITVQHVLPESAPIFAKGSYGVALYPTIAGRSSDLLVEKTTPSVFSTAAFGAWLAEHQIDTLTIIGYMTHNCVDATARDAAHRGFEVEILSDATGSLPYKNKAGSASAEDLHRCTLTVMESAYAAVLTTQQWIDRLHDATAAPRDNIFHSNQRALGVL